MRDLQVEIDTAGGPEALRQLLLDLNIALQARE